MSAFSNHTPVRSDMNVFVPHARQKALRAPRERQKIAFDIRCLRD
jgi:hypothetical protein